MRLPLAVPCCWSYSSRDTENADAATIAGSNFKDATILSKVREPPPAQGPTVRCQCEPSVEFFALKDLLHNGEQAEKGAESGGADEEAAAGGRPCETFKAQTGQLDCKSHRY